MKSDYGYPECAFCGPTAPRVLLFILSWEAKCGAPAGPCEVLVKQYPEEVDVVLDEWDGLTQVCDTLRAMRARIAGREALAEIEGKKQ